MKFGFGQDLRTSRVERISYRFHLYHTYFCGDRAFGITTGYGLDDRGIGVRVPVRPRILFSLCRLRLT
jgi:hypothetical protein